MEPIRIINALSHDVIIEITQPEKDNTATMINLCKRLVNNKILFSVLDALYTKAMLPEFIHDMYKLFSFNLGMVYNQYKSDIEHIQNDRLSVLDFLNKKQ